MAMSSIASGQVQPNPNQPNNVETLLGRNSTFLFDRSFDISPVPNSNTFSFDNPPTQFLAKLSQHWSGGNNRLIGSYVYCVVLKCLSAYSTVIGYPDAVSMHVDFHSFGPVGAECEIRVRERKRGGKYVFVEGEMRLRKEEGVEWEAMSSVVSVHAVFGLLPDAKDARHLLPTRFQEPSKIGVKRLPPLEECEDLYKALGMVTLSYLDQGDQATLRNTIRTGVDGHALRDDIARASKAISLERADPTSTFNFLDSSELPHWIWMSDGRPNDCHSIAYHSDMYPPNLALLDRADREQNGYWWMPTSLSFHIIFFARTKGVKLRRVLRAGAHVTNGDSGLCDFEILIWSEDGDRLVAASRQSTHLLKVSMDSFGPSGFKQASKFVGKEEKSKI